MRDKKYIRMKMLPAMSEVIYIIVSDITGSILHLIGLKCTILLQTFKNFSDLFIFIFDIFKTLSELIIR